MLIKVASGPTWRLRPHPFSLTCRTCFLRTSLAWKRSATSVRRAIHWWLMGWEARNLEHQDPLFLHFVLGRLHCLHHVCVRWHEEGQTLRLVNASDKHLRIGRQVHAGICIIKKKHYLLCLVRVQLGFTVKIILPHWCFLGTSPCCSRGTLHHTPLERTCQTSTAAALFGVSGFG